MQIVSFGRQRIDSFTRWQSEKNSFKLVQIWREKTQTSGHVQLKYHTKTEPKQKDLLLGVKEDQMMWRRCFQPWGFRYSYFLTGWEESRKAAHVQFCNAVLRSYLCSYQLGSATDDKIDCFSAWLLTLVGTPLWHVKWGAKWTHWQKQTQGETRLDWNDLRIQRVFSECFQRDFLSRGCCKKVFLFLSSWASSSFLFFSLTRTMKNKIQDYRKSSHWSQSRGKVSLASTQSHGVIKAWEPNTIEELAHREGRAASISLKT